MTGEQYEKQITKYFKNRGFWALNIPKNHTGAQPFDILAIKEGKIVAVDCKVISGDSARFPMARIELNQLSAFDRLDKASPWAVKGFVVLFDDVDYFLPYDKVMRLLATGKSSVDIRQEVTLEKYFGR